MQGRETTGRTALLGGGLGLTLAAFFLLPSAMSHGVPARGDLADFFWPMKLYTAARWAGGVPLWNPLSGCGEPWLAQLQSGVFYPGDVSFFLHGNLGPLLGIALHLVVAAAGMAAWLGGLGTSRVGALFGSLVYAGAGGFLSLVLVYNNFETAAWLPWLCVAARFAVCGGSPAWFAGAVALSFLGGEPALALMGTLAAGALALLTRNEEPAGTVARSTRRPLARLVAGALLGSALVAAAALPFVEYVVASGRAQGVTRSEAVARSVGGSDLVDLVLPPADALTRTPSPGRGGYLATLALSPLVLLLAAGSGAGLAARPRLLAGLVVVGVVGVCLSAGVRGGLIPLLWSTGIARGIRFPARWFVFTQLALAALAGAGFDGWRYGRLLGWAKSRDGADPHAEGPGRARFLPLVFFPLATALLFLAGLAMGRLSGAASLSAVVSTALGGAVLARWRYGPAIPSAASAVGLVALAVVPFVGAAAGLFAPAIVGGTPRVVATLGGPSAGRVFPVASDGAVLAAVSRESAGEWGGAAAARERALLSGYTNLDAGIASAASPSPIGDPRRTRLLGAALAGGNAETLLALADVRHVVSPLPMALGGARLEGRAPGIFVYRLPRALGRVFFARSAREADDAAAFRTLVAPDFNPEAVVLLAPPSGPRPPARAGKSFSVARIVEDLPERLRLDAESSEAGFLVLTRTFDRGWEARLDGALVPLLRADLALSAILLPAGSHRLELVYRPLAFRAGVVVSLGALLVAAAMGLAGRRA